MVGEFAFHDLFEGSKCPKIKKNIFGEKPRNLETAGKPLKNNLEFDFELSQSFFSDPAAEPAGEETDLQVLQFPKPATLGSPTKGLV